MDFGFYNIVLIVAVVLLILTLTYIGVKMTYQAYSAPFPPVKATCPDYWDISSDGKTCVIPTSSDHPNMGNPSNVGGRANYGTVGTTNDVNGNPVFDPNDSRWASYLGTKGGSICGLRTWANTYGVVWDGVTNFNKC